MLWLLLPHFQMEKMRHRESQWLAQAHTASKWQSQKYEASGLACLVSFCLAKRWKWEENMAKWTTVCQEKDKDERTSQDVTSEQLWLCSITIWRLLIAKTWWKRRDRKETMILYRRNGWAYQKTLSFTWKLFIVKLYFWGPLWLDYNNHWAHISTVPLVSRKRSVSLSIPDSKVMKPEACPSLTLPMRTMSERLNVWCLGPCWVGNQDAC